MDHVENFTHGALTPAIAYVVMVMAAVIGLRCAVRAVDSIGTSRRNWLMTAAVALATGIWTLHFIAMLGFGVQGSPVRYNVPITLISFIVAVVVVGVGVLTVGYGRDRIKALALGGLGTGFGVAAMHYSGMAAVEIEGTVRYHPSLVALSILIAVTAATAALWLAFNIRGVSGAIVSGLVMGVAVASMHYTAMAAVWVELDPGADPLTGATAEEFLLPLSVGITALLFIAFMIIAVSPIDPEYSDADAEESLRVLQERRERFAEQIEAQIAQAERRPAGHRRR